MIRTIRSLVPLEWRKSIKIGRARAFERFGSFRYSEPSLSGLLTQVLPHLPSTGVYLEIGANDGYSQSNTYYLDRVRGWDGILIEPVPRLYERCRQVRTKAHCVRAACTAESDDAQDVELIDLDLMTVALGQQDEESESRRLHRAGARISAPAMRLSDVIDASPYDSVTFMSIDVEGAEEQVLRGLDLERHCPDLLLIETSKTEAVERILGSHMELVDRLSVHDFLWRRR